jgi:hypothetical protein
MKRFSVRANAGVRLEGEAAQHVEHAPASPAPELVPHQVGRQGGGEGGGQGPDHAHAAGARERATPSRSGTEGMGQADLLGEHEDEEHQVGVHPAILSCDGNPSIGG